MRLDRYDNSSFQRGRSRWIEAAWMLVQAALVSSPLPGSRHRVALLRLFGAKIGEGVVVKPRVHIKFPWRLELGDHCWIGEAVWIDNLARVSIGSHTCVSQASYFCTGNHDYSSERFDLRTEPIVIGDQAWVCARSTIGPGVVVESGAVLGLGSVATKRLKAWTIYRGCPAAEFGPRSQPMEERPRDGRSAQDPSGS